MLDHVSLGVQDIHIRHDRPTGLVAVIALDKPDIQPALGGCRCIPYTSLDDAIVDATKLAKAMSRKNHFGSLPFTGGKAVLMRPEGDFDREAYFKAFGRFVESLQGRFITGCDSGVDETDMRHAATQTRYITGFKSADGDGDTLSYLTALGVSRAIHAATAIKFGAHRASPPHVAVQGVGKVGHLLARILREQGGRVTLCDNDAGLAQQCGRAIGAEVVRSSDIYDVECDVFAPCGIGGVLTHETLSRIKARIVCGAANNPLHADSLDTAGFDRGIEYIPDFIANAGGAMYAAGAYLKRPLANIVSDVSEKIHDTVLRLCTESSRRGVPVLQLANEQLCSA